jgi:hypothetical protein
MLFRNVAAIPIYPSLVGGETASSIFRAQDLPIVYNADLTSGLGAKGTIPLRIMAMEKLKGDVIWLRYEIKQ